MLRYTDFLVNEILPDGRVLRLTSTAVPDSIKSAKPKETEPPKPDLQPAHEPPTEFHLSSQDHSDLVDCFGEDTAAAIVDLHTRALAGPAKPAALGRVKSHCIDNKEARTRAHQTIRRLFASRLDSTTDNDGAVIISIAKKGNSGRGGRSTNERPGKLGWAELGGEFLHFSVYKENKDTMEVISFLAKQMKMKPKGFQFAGTKDRRAVTVQRASVFRLHAERLADINRTLRNAALGDFEYKPSGLGLGDLAGNQFTITLRDCHFPEGGDSADALARAALRNLADHGYINYYGLQRFGTFATRTDAVGLCMLQSDYAAAVAAILAFNPTLLDPVADVSRTSADDLARARALAEFRDTGKSARPLATLPRKFAAEAAVIRHLGRIRNDWLGALQAIPRNLRLMYVHAYQSLVWNHAVSERWRRFGNTVVEGDLVLIPKTGATKLNNAETDDVPVDADGDPIILPPDDAPDDPFDRARPLSADEAASGAYSPFDLVLPLPGFDVVYPANEIGGFYHEFMASNGGLDPTDMRRGWKDVSLPGGYRQVLGRLGDQWDLELRECVEREGEAEEQFVETDLERLRRVADKRGANQGLSQEQPYLGPFQENDTQEQPSNLDKAQPRPAEEQRKLAVILTLRLGASQYATMALRELGKNGIRAYKPDFGGGR